MAGDLVFGLITSSRSFHSSRNRPTLKLKREFSSISEFLGAASGFLVMCKEGGKILLPYLGYIGSRLAALTRLEKFSLYMNVVLLVLVKTIYDNVVEIEAKSEENTAEHKEDIAKMKAKHEEDISNLKVANERDILALKANVTDEIARSASFRALTAESLLKNVLSTRSDDTNNECEKSEYWFVGQIVMENNALRAELSKLKAEAGGNGSGDQLKGSGTTQYD